MSKVAVIVGRDIYAQWQPEVCLSADGPGLQFCAVQYCWNAVSVKQSCQIAESVEAGFKGRDVEHISLTNSYPQQPDRGDMANLVEETAKLIPGRRESR